MRRARFCLIVGAWLLSPVVCAETAYVTDRVTVALRADATPDAVVLATVSTGTPLEVLERSGSLVRVRDANGVEGWVEAKALTPQPPAAQQLKTLRAELDRARAQLADTQALLQKSQAKAPAIEKIQAELAGTRAELDRTRAQLANAQGLLQKSQAAQNPAAEKIQAELAGTRAQLNKVQAELKQKDEEAAAAIAARDVAVKEAATLREAAARGAARRATAPTPMEPPKPPESATAGGFSFLWIGIAFAMLVAGFIGGIVWVKESIRRRMGGLHLRI